MSGDIISSFSLEKGAVDQTPNFDAEVLKKLFKLLNAPNPPAIPIEWFQNKPGSKTESESSIKKDSPSMESLTEAMRRLFLEEGEAKTKASNILSCESMASALEKLFKTESEKYLPATSSSDSIEVALKKLFESESKDEVKPTRGIISQGSLLSAIRQLFSTGSEEEITHARDVLSSESLASAIRNLFSSNSSESVNKAEECWSNYSIASAVRRMLEDDYEESKTSAQDTNSDDSLIAYFKRWLEDDDTAEEDQTSVIEALKQMLKKEKDEKRAKQPSNILSNDSLTFALRELFKTAASHSQLDSGREAKDILSNESLASALKEMFDQETECGKSSQKSTSWDWLDELIKDYS